MKNLMLRNKPLQEEVSQAFSRQSVVFDELDNRNEILQWMRSRIREHVIKLWKPGQLILELNAGTGVDAVFFSENGFRVHATDNAPGMIGIIQDKIRILHLENRITAQRCSFHELDKLKPQKFDHIFSNFGGLNCTDELGTVIKSFKDLLNPGGTVTLVIMPPVCLWELLYFFRGNFKLAFRRFKKHGTVSHLEGVNFMTWYYSPSKVKSMFGEKYTILSVIGLGIIIPPPFLESFPVQFPNIFKRLVSLENKIATRAPFNSWGDHFIITAKKQE